MPYSAKAQEMTTTMEDDIPTTIKPMTHQPDDISSSLDLILLGTWAGLGLMLNGLMLGLGSGVEVVQALAAAG